MWTASVAGSGQVNRYASHDGSVAAGGVARWMVSSSVRSSCRIHAGCSPMSRRAIGSPHTAPSTSIAGAAGGLGRGGGGDLAGVGQRLEVGGVVGGGVQALPQQRQRLGAVQRPRLDPGAPQRGVDLVAQPQALDGCLPVHRPRHAAAGSGGQCAQLLAGVLEHRAVGHDDPPAREHGGLLGACGRPHRLLGGGEQPPPRPRELVVTFGAVLAAGDAGGVAVGGERVADRDRVGLREDLQALTVGDDAAQLREGVLDA